MGENHSIKVNCEDGVINSASFLSSLAMGVFTEVFSDSSDVAAGAAVTGFFISKQIFENFDYAICEYSETISRITYATITTSVTYVIMRNTKYNNRNHHAELLSAFFGMAIPEVINLLQNSNRHEELLLRVIPATITTCATHFIVRNIRDNNCNSYTKLLSTFFGMATPEIRDLLYDFFGFFKKKSECAVQDEPNTVSRKSVIKDTNITPVPIGSNIIKKPKPTIKTSNKFLEVKIQSEKEINDINTVFFNIIKEWTDQKRFYAVLNITESSSPAEIKAAYNKLSILLHPDSISNNIKELGKKLLIKLNKLKKPLINHSSPGYFYPDHTIQSLKESCETKRKTLKEFLERNKGIHYSEYKEEYNEIVSNKESACQEYSDYLTEKIKQENSYKNTLNKNLPYGVSQPRTMDEEIKTRKAELAVKFLNNTVIRDIRDFVAIQDLSCDEICKSNDKIPNPYIAMKSPNAACVNNQKLKEVFFEEGLDQSQYDQFNDIIANINLVDISLNDNQNSFFIPKIIHSIIFIPRECKGDMKCIKTILNAKKDQLLKTKIDGEWSYNLWFDPIQADIVPGIINILDVPSVNLKSLDENNLAITASENEIAWKILISSRIWGSSYPKFATNLAKFLVMQKYGGIYLDYNYHILDNSLLEELSQNYNSFFIAKQQNDGYQIDDNFFGVSANNDIINEAVDIIGRNIFNVAESPAYIKYPCDSKIRIDMISGYIPLTISFVKNQQQKDIILSDNQSLVENYIDENDIIGDLIIYSEY